MRIASVIITILLASQSVFTQQEMLSKQEAINKVLENNFGIKIARNNVEIADNNKAILNSGFLPTLTGVAGASYDKNDQEATFQDGNTAIVDGAETTRYNASLNLNYTLFDGMGRWYDYKRLKEEYNLSELQARETIETTIVQLFTVYFEVARISENIQVLQDTYTNTQERLQRAEYAFEYGQSNKLDVLNAQVDLVNDSINLMTERQLFKNTVRDLNVVLNEEMQTAFEVDTTITFINPIDLDNFYESSEDNNVSLLQAKSNISISEYNLKSSRSVFLPTIGLTGSYGWNESNFPPTGFLAASTSTGVSGGVNLTWNLFDGGGGITQVKNTKILRDNQEYLKNQLLQQIRRDIANAKGNYENSLEVFRLQEQNVLTAKDNFNRSNERYKLGQITSVELRQAQINLLNAETSKNQAKYAAKLSELQYLQLVGQLLNTDI